MDKFPLLWEGTSLGELTVEQEPLYTWFTAAACRERGSGAPGSWGTRGNCGLGSWSRKTVSGGGFPVR